jgi:hypothetical protein
VYLIRIKNLNRLLKINFYEGRIMKKLEKQLVSALAIGIGAGLMMLIVK